MWALSVIGYVTGAVVIAVLAIFIAGYVAGMAHEFRRIWRCSNRK